MEKFNYIEFFKQHHENSMSRHYMNVIKMLFIFKLIFVFFIIISCSSNKKIVPNEEISLESRTFSFEQNNYPTAKGLFPAYEVSSGDILDVFFQIRTWQRKENLKLAVDHTISVKFVHNSELNETQRIQPDGKIYLPYIGETYVLNKTVPELTHELKTRYAKILRDTEIYVTVPEFRSRIKELKSDLHTAPRGLSRLVRVRPDGYATFPLIGDIFVAGNTIPQINKQLDKMYDEYLPGLHVDLFLEKHAGSVIYVLGQVEKPGAHNIVKPINVVEALALAGGFNNQAKLNTLIIFRKHEKKLIATMINIETMLEPDKQHKFFYLKPDDIVYVPRKITFKITDIVREISDILLFRGWSIGLSGIIYEDSIIK